MSYNVMDIANKIVAKTDIEHGDSISNLKLQKMLYYMQGFHLAYFNTPLFEEDVVAWQYGPVIPSVYSAFKDFGKGEIALSESTNIINLTSDEEILFNEVYEVYGQFSAIKLMEMTHNENPWKTTEISDVISKDKLKSFFKTRINE